MNAHALPFTVLALFTATLAWAEPDSFADLQQIEIEYANRRAEALRSVDAWHEAQLQTLLRAHEQPELRKAILASNWLWRSAVDPRGVVVKFHEDGTVDHVNMTGHWRITGPCEITISPDEHEPIVLKFNSTFTEFGGSRDEISGCRFALEP